MDVTSRRKKATRDASPYNRREEKDAKKAFKSVEKSVKSVGKGQSNKKVSTKKVSVKGKKLPKAKSPVVRPSKDY